jgi:tetratricopeptide (TPR) repeat protein
MRSACCAAVLVLAAAGHLSVRGAEASQGNAVEVAVARGDDSYARGQLREALASYQSAASLDAAHVGALVGLSRVEADLCESARGEERRRLVASAVEHARTAVKAAPENAAGHLCLAVALERQLGVEGPKTRAALEREIKSELEQAITLDPSSAQSYFERGLWNRRLATMSLWQRGLTRVMLAGLPRGASMENATRDLEHAVELSPDAIDYRLELARTYLKLKRDADARRELERALALPGNRPRDPGLQAEARSLLEKLAKRG